MAATTWVAQHPVIKSSLRRVLHFKQSNVSNNYVNENTNSGLGEGLHSDIRVRVHSATEVVNHHVSNFTTSEVINVVQLFQQRNGG